jgi:hypothetical protein
VSEAKCANPNKWICPILQADDILEDVFQAKRKYELQCFEYRSDITRAQAADEFWLRLSERWGFKIDFCRETDLNAGVKE